MKALFGLVLVVLSFLSCLELVESHGHLVKPTPRDLTNAPSDFIDTSTGQKPTNNFICRNQPASTPQVEVSAGGKLTLQWTFPALHVGDCAVYITYDTNKPQSEQMWFKIQDFPKCKDQHETDVQLDIPSWLPQCEHCILRWEWIALHVRPRIELYNQCVDIKINGNANGFLGKPIFKIPGHIPEDGRDYRNAFGGSFFLVGPAEATPGQIYPDPTSTDLPLIPCTKLEDCANNLCLITGFCAQDLPQQTETPTNGDIFNPKTGDEESSTKEDKSSTDDSGLGAAGISAIVFALLFVTIVVGVVLGVLLRDRFNIPSRVPTL